MTVEAEETDVTVDAEDEAARLVEAEQELREAIDEAATSENDTPDGRIDLRLGDSSVHRARVIGGGRTPHGFELTVAANGTEETFTLPWPSDPTDPEEPLIRLADREGVPVDRIADLDAVTVLETDNWGNYCLPIPPAKARQTTTIVLPRGFDPTISRVTITARCRRLYYRFFLAAARTRLASVEDTFPASSSSYDVNIEALGVAGVAIGTTSVIALLLVARTVPTGALALLGLLFGVFLATGVDDLDNWFDAY